MKEQITTLAVEKLSDYGYELFFIERSGSRLHGTDKPDSDHDFKGVYIPPLDFLLLGNKPAPIYVKQDNFDCCLWPIQQFIQLCRNGETNAVDLYFAAQASLDKSKNLKLFFELLPPEKLINRTQAKSFTGFAIQMARRYGIRGERYQALKRIEDYFNPSAWLAFKLDVEYVNLEIHMKKIAEVANNKDYCYLTVSNNTPSLFLCGKIHHGSISMEEFLDRLKSHLANYGARVKSNLEAPDWKSISHAVRVLAQYTELLKYGTMTFPLVHWVSYLKAVKSGQVDFHEVTDKIDQLVSQIDSRLLEMENDFWAYDEERVLKFLNKVYSCEC